MSDDTTQVADNAEVQQNGDSQNNEPTAKETEGFQAGATDMPETPPAPAEEKENPLQAELAATKAKAQEYLDGWQRERAEFANFKKRIERDIKDTRQKASLDVLTSLLPIIDDFERAMTSVPEDFKEQPWLNGITLIQRKLQKLLDDNQVTIIDPVGQVFDPSRHEALGVDENSSVESGHITVTLQKGYMCGDKVLRPALVRIAG